MKKIVTPLANMKPYKPAPHPMQHRIDEFRKVPSMWNGKTYEANGGSK